MEGDGFAAQLVEGLLADDIAGDDDERREDALPFVHVLHRRAGPGGPRRAAPPRRRRPCRQQRALGARAGQRGAPVPREARAEASSETCGGGHGDDGHGGRRQELVGEEASERSARGWGGRR